MLAVLQILLWWKKLLSLNCLKDGFKRRSMTTDYHILIRAFLEKVRPGIIHQFNFWHVSISIKKKLSQKSAKWEKLTERSKSIRNHFCWCYRTCEGNQKLLKEKRVSLLIHIMNRHTWETYKNFTVLNRCAHPPLSIHQEEYVEWLEGNSPDFQALDVIFLDKGLLKDLDKLTKFWHTGQIEVFQSLINKYWPKRLHFSTASQNAWHQLSVMNHNSDSDTECDHKINSSGDVVTKILNPWNFGFLNQLGKRKRRSICRKWWRKLLKLKPKILLWTLPISQKLQKILQRLLV